MNYLLSIQKDEHKYIQEWFNHHIGLGFDKIVVFNNSSIPYNINHPKYKEFDVSLNPAPQPACYNWFFQDQVEINDTVTVLDGDEFLTELVTPTSDVDVIRYSWQGFGDCGKLKYEDAPVQLRFPTPLPKDFIYNDRLPSGITENFHTKYTIRKTHKPAILDIHTAHVLNGISTNVNGQVTALDCPWMDICWSGPVVKHYFTKSTEEWCQRRLNKKDACGSSINSNILVRWYFNANEKTKEKEELIKEFL